MSYGEQNATLMSKVVVRNSNDEILVLLRSKTAHVRPLTWDLPGGLIEVDEAPEKSAIREVQEETGIKLETVEKLDFSYTVKRDGYDGPVITFTYTYKLNSDDNDVKLSAEHIEYKWVSKKEFLELEMPEKYKDATKLLNQYRL